MDIYSITVDETSGNNEENINAKEAIFELVLDNVIVTYEVIFTENIEQFEVVVSDIKVTYIVEPSTTFFSSGIGDAPDEQLYCRRNGQWVALAPVQSLELGNLHTNAYYGDLGKIAYDHSQATGNPHQLSFSGLSNKPTTVQGYGITDIPAWALSVSKPSYTTSEVTEADNLYFTQSRVLSTIISGYSPVDGNVNSSDSILSAINKLGNNKHLPLTLGSANGLTLDGQQLSLALASGTTTGSLSYSDWTVFNNKQPAGNYSTDIHANITALDNVSGINTGDQLDILGNSATTTKLLNARTINGISFDGTQNIVINAVDSTARIPMSYMGIANGVATLDGNGIILTTQLPSYIDDVLEFANLASFPVIGETGKIYVAKDTNKTYRWSGSTYVYITSGAVDSVNGYTGIITLNKSDIGLSNVSNELQWSISNHPTTTSGYGLPNYPTTLPASDVYLWAKQPDKPSYSFAELQSKPTTLSGYGITDAIQNQQSVAQVGGLWVSQLIKTSYGITVLHTGNDNPSVAPFINFQDPSFSVSNSISMNGTGGLSVNNYQSGVGTVKTFTISKEGNITSLGYYTGTQYKVIGGTSSQYLKADGSLDANTYQPLGTAINTGNIAGQSVNYANSAGNATNWSGYELDFDQAVSVNRLIAFDSSDNTFRVADSPSIKSWLGLGSSAYTNTSSFIQNQNSSAQSANMWISGLIKTNLGSGGLSLCGDGTPDEGYIGYNYDNVNGTQTIVQSGRASWRIKFKNGSGDIFGVDYRSPNVGANIFSNYFNINSSGAATFTSNVTLGGELLLNTNASRLRLQRSTGDNYIDYNNNNGLIFRSISNTDTGAINVLTFTPSGAATFASTVNATQFNASNTISVPSLTANGYFKLNYGANTNSRVWQIANDGYGYGDFTISQSTTQTSSTFTRKLIINNGNLTIGETPGIGGGSIYATQLQSTVATGTAPLIVNSTTMVSNLNAQFSTQLNALPGYDANISIETGGVISNYNSPSSWINAPFGMSYGSIYQFNSARTNRTELALQLAVDGSNLSFRNNDGSNFSVWRNLYHSGNLTNNLTTNYIPKWNGSSMVNSLISDDGTNIQIGVGTPFTTGAKLNIIGTSHGLISQTSGGWGGVFKNTTTGLECDISGAGDISVQTNGRIVSTSTTQSTSPTTGALVVGGGIGANNIFSNSYSLSNAYNNWSIVQGTSDNHFAIVDNQFGERFRIFTNGNVGIGYTTDQGYKLAVNGSGYFNGDVYTNTLYNKSSYSASISTYQLSNGTYRVDLNGIKNLFAIDISANAVFNGNVTASNFILSSDRTLKTNIQPIYKDYSKLSLVSFNFKDNLNELRFGTIAQDLLSSGYSEFVTGDKEGEYKVKYIDLIIAKLASAELRIKELEDKYGSR